MQIRLLFLDSAKNQDITQKRFKKKYKSMEELFAQVQQNRCNDPELVDDYMVWQTIVSHEHKADSEEHSESSSSSEQSTSLIFNEEIVLQAPDFFQTPTPRRMELLEYIRENNPSSMKNLAAETGRDYKNVYDDVLALQKAQLLELISEGKNKRPVVRLNAIEVLFK
jgi:predicted transcriptional regulator